MRFIYKQPVQNPFLLSGIIPAAGRQWTTDGGLKTAEESPLSRSNVNPCKRMWRESRQWSRNDTAASQCDDPTGEVGCMSDETANLTGASPNFRYDVLRTGG